MKRFLIILVSLMLSTSVLAQDADTKIAERNLREFKAMLPGTYTNEEQVYFQGNLEMPEERHLPRLTLIIESDGEDFIAKTINPKTGATTEARLTYRVEDGNIQSREIREGEPDCERVFTRHFDQFRGEGCGGDVIADPRGFSFGYPDNPFVMKRARFFKCWVSPQKSDESYAFYNDVVLHDQGGWAWVEGDEHERVGLKMRNVDWPAGTNRSSFVLYAYRGEDEEKAESYAWSSPDAERIGINLRWMQASCTLGDDAITPSINLKTGSGE